MALTWTVQSSPAAGHGVGVQGLAANPTTGTVCQSFFNAGPNTTDIYRSTDGGVSWTLVESYAGSAVGFPIMVCDGTAWIVPLGPFYLRSVDDGVTWTPVVSGYATAINSLAQDGAGTILAFSNGSGIVNKSTDHGATWAQHAIPVRSNWAVIWDGIQFVGVVSQGTLFTSPDGVTWTITSGFGADTLEIVAHQGSQYLVGLNNNGYYRETTVPPSGWPGSAALAIPGFVPSSGTGIVSGGGLWSANDGTGHYASSIDGLTWSAGTIAPSTFANYDIYVPVHNIFMLGTVGGFIYTSDAVSATVPNVIGQVLATGEANIVAAGLIVGTVSDAASGIIPVGDIISTNPVAGTLAAFGSAVDIVKSIGPPNTVPDVIGFTLAAGETDIIAAGLTVGVVTSAFSGSVPIGDIIITSPIAGSIVSPGSPVDIVESAGPGIVVPDLTGLTQADASSAITAATLVLGPVTSAFSNTVPAGLVFAQSPVAGARVAPGSAVGFTVSLGPQTVAVPDVVGLTAAAAESALALAHLISGTITGVLDPSIPIGSVATQSPAAGTLVLVGSPVDIGISFVVPEFDVDATVISQYANSPRILELVEDFGQYFDPAINIQNFYLTVWNIDTAAGFGLDIWGIILGVSRVIPIPGTSGTFGFETADVPPDWENFGDPSVPGAGGPFFSGQVTGNSYKLEDAPYRTLLLTKALANICATTAVALNALITNLFPGRGRCYTLDRGAMQMSYVFEFPLTTIEFAILAYSGVLAHPAGVGFNIVVIDAHYFGFEEAGPPLEPWNFGTFFNG